MPSSVAPEPSTDRGAMSTARTTEAIRSSTSEFRARPLLSREPRGDMAPWRQRLQTMWDVAMKDPPSLAEQHLSSAEALRNLRCSVVTRMSVMAMFAAGAYVPMYAVLPFPSGMWALCLLTVFNGLAALAFPSPERPADPDAFDVRSTLLVLGMFAPVTCLAFVVGAYSTAVLAATFCSLMAVLVLRGRARYLVLAVNGAVMLYNDLGETQDRIDWDAVNAALGGVADFRLPVYAATNLLFVALVAVTGHYVVSRQELFYQHLMARMRGVQRRREADLKAQGNSKLDFMAMVSHELRTPLNGIVGFSELLAGHLAADASLGPLAGTIHESSLTLLTIINKVLEFSSVSDGQTLLRDEELDPVALVESTTKALYPMAAKQGIELLQQTTSLPDGLRLAGDPERLRQVLCNLVGNALKFTERGHVLVRACYEPGGALCFHVEDTGVGIPPDALERIFDPFKQAADMRTRRRHDGTGLGLSISKTLCELMGGGLTVKSALGRGSVFSASVALRVVAEPPPPRRPSGADPWVLLFDPVDARAAVMTDLLLREGVHTQRCMSIDALAAAAASTPGALASVVDTPRPEDVAELSVELRLPVVVVASGLDTSPCAGAAFALRKPVERAALRRVVGALRAGLTSPAASQAATPARSTTPTAAPLPADLDVLLVEDNAVNQKVVGNMLRRLGVQTHRVANDGREGVAAFAQRTPSVVLMDCHMPVMDGFEAAKTIRQMGSARGQPQRRVPIIAVTADTFSNDKIWQAGMDGFVVKPLTLQALREALLQFAPYPSAQ